MTKVKVSKEVADILQIIEDLSKGDLNDKFARLGIILYNQNAVTPLQMYDAIQSHGEDWELFNALQFGYEIIKTPEEELVDYFESHVRKAEQNDYANYDDGIVEGVLRTLELLEIKIKDVNDSNELSNMEKYGTDY